MSQNKGSNCLFNFRSFGNIWSFHEMERRKKNKKVERSRIKEEVIVKEEGKRYFKNRSLTF